MAPSPISIFRTLRDNNQKIVHSHEVIIALDELLSSMQDAETGQRGFLLTNNEKYLEPYNSAVMAIPPKLDEIAQLTSDNPAQKPRITALKLHIGAKLAELKETIDLRRTQGLDTALAVVNSDRGKVEMDAIRAQLAAMSQEEADLRSRRFAEMNAAQKTALASSLLSGASRHSPDGDDRLLDPQSNTGSSARGMASIGPGRIGIRDDRGPAYRATRQQHS